MQPLAALSEDLRRRARQAQAEGRLDEAEALFSAAVQADPQSLPPRLDRGRFYKLVGRLEAAEADLRIAHRLAPDDAGVRHVLGFVLLSQGRYPEGWRFYEARHDVPGGFAKARLPFPEWNGEDPTGKRILIAPEQGYGDQIQFARFAPWLAARGAEVTLISPPGLTALYRQSFEVQVIEARGPVEFPDPDYWAMSGSLAGRAGLELAQIPNAPYLRSDVTPVASARGIGVAFKGNPTHGNDANRSLPPRLAADLLALPGAISLHPEDTGAADFAATAALIEPLELVISVDTSIAHLAAAIGKPTWILLPKLMTDWRWLEARTDSPWYPSARLFRQPAAGDWDSVLEDVRRALARRS